MIIIVHSKEERKKCTLYPLRNLAGLSFCNEFDYSVDADALLLHPDGRPLTKDDREMELVLLDATWSHFNMLLQRNPILNGLRKRSIAGYVTAFPRKAKKKIHTKNHLASIEVIIASGLILKIPEYSRLLEGYHFRKQFIGNNSQRPELLAHLKVHPVVWPE